MPRYKVIAERGAYLPRSAEVVRLDLGADAQAARAYGVRAQVCELLPEGAEIDYAGEPGPHLEPLDEPAREAMAAYWKAHPNATLDPTRSLPLGQDPLLRPTFEQTMLRSLERMAAEAAAGTAPASAVDAKLDALTDALAKLAAIVGQGFATFPSGRKTA
jgi:hypothetical protein